MTKKSTGQTLHPFVTPLTLAGALPFLGCSLAAWRLLQLPFDPAYAAVVYAAVILSFLGGIQWSFFLTEPAPKAWIIIISNLLALQGWGVVLLFTASPSGACIVLALGLCIALWVDGNLCRQGFLPENFYRLRQLTTALVVPCLLATASAQHFVIAAHLS
ncbi:DUF3429 domain-containing protein [Asticcacaulis sp. AC402]|uniref:DUF3429 domain-containing protein n=1 Tax=Asticcacaulis sp. AC402 TaxID=1282361 RepID=UPI0003C3BF1E|nr:DUF3429 domain-containing protein [Asticcacaulis sp. AC402]ESQ75286.1 hypothetical protein ABAC402_09280 [Asticcacaulis sp. AC402]